jgi:hypothetical protein
MPSLITLGAVSGRGFGATNPVLPPVLTTTTFTSSGNWVAPLSVANVAAIYGYGQDGSPSSTNYTTQYWAVPLSGNLGNSPYAQWGDLYGRATSVRSALLALIGSAGPSSVSVSYEFYVSATNNSWSVPNDNYDDFSAYTINSVGGLTSQGNVSTSGNIIGSSLAAGVNGWNFIVNLGIPGFQGASSTGLGKTFPGGNGGPPSTTSFSNVAVTPGVSYPISVAPGGSVTLQYYV